MVNEESDEEREQSQLLEEEEPVDPGFCNSGGRELQGATEGQERDRELERLLDSAGYGFFHVLVLLVLALALSADAVEVVGVGFVVPVAEQDLALDTPRKGYLDASVFVGRSTLDSKELCPPVYSRL
jgi:hypothetical protein